MDEVPTQSDGTTEDSDPPDDPTRPFPALADNTSFADQLKGSWWTRTSSQRMGRQQFSLSWMLGLTVAVAVLFSFASWSGVGFAWFFLGLWLIALIFGPFVIFLVLLLCPWIEPRHRKWVALAIGLLLLFSIPLFPGLMDFRTASAFYEDLGNLLGMMGGTLLCAWGPQVLLLWIIFSWRPIRGLAGSTNPSGRPVEETPLDAFDFDDE